ncbi:uncharacterized protein LOC110111964 [Dendrobium catenatum]|uniref:uncharacterized protein LOC110111964 n=1 Tax=Dendrobium catenatum TaxID=906689 RepID=UPI0009F5598E|nr:uncharacterized protein LOC110111964 [Dendrobium catenatum]
MGDKESANSLPPSSSTLSNTSSTILSIPAPLKFLVSNIKNLVPHPLTSDNYAIWWMQILQQFSANGYAGHLNGATTSPTDVASTDYTRWRLVYNNLLSALFSMISQSILPYIISSTTAQDAWSVLERRLQPTSRSSIIQLKNKLHHIQLRDSTMQQYLAQIKFIIDNIAFSGSKIDMEDIILYILNGLPPTYNSFKTTICTSLLPIDLDSFYSILCSEEINLQQENLKEILAGLVAITLYSSSYYQSCGRNQKRFFKNKNSPAPSNNPLNQSAPSASTAFARPTYQICGKTGHIALNSKHQYIKLQVRSHCFKTTTCSSFPSDCFRYRRLGS